MRILIFLLQKEFKQMFRDPLILKLVFVMPAIQLLILPFAADYEIKNINVGIVDHDHSSYSRELIQKIENSNYFHLAGYSDSYEESLGFIANDQVDLFIEIPLNFESDLIRENEASLLLSVNAVNGTKGSIGAAYATGIIREYNNDLRNELVQWPRIKPFPLVDITYSNLYNKESNYQVFMVPGLIGVLLTMVAAFLTALNIVREKEIGTIEQLNVSPIKKYQFILGKLIPFWMLGFVVLTIGLIISFVVYGITPGLNLGVLYMFSAVYLLAILGLGLLISNFTDTQQQALMISFFFMVIFILMSGLYTPIESMPEWAQDIAMMNPMTYMVEVMRMILLKGANFADIKTDFIKISMAGIVLNGAAMWSYRKRS